MCYAAITYFIFNVLWNELLECKSATPSGAVWNARKVKGSLYISCVITSLVYYITGVSASVAELNLLY